MSKFTISKASAINMAKWRVKLKADDPSTSMIRKLGLNAALNGGLEEIFDEVYGLGFTISADENDPRHQQWLASGAIAKE